jgi:hypothetical protein
MAFRHLRCYLYRAAPTLNKHPLAAPSPIPCKHCNFNRNIYRTRNSVFTRKNRAGRLAWLQHMFLPAHFQQVIPKDLLLLSLSYFAHRYSTLASYFGELRELHAK